MAGAGAYALPVDVAVLGTWALRAGALAAGAAALTAARRSPPRWLPPVALASVTAAVGCLVWALLTGDFRLTYVADTTSRSAAWPARLAALWGGMSGSLLFWGWLLTVAAVVGSAVVRRARPDLAPTATSVMAAAAAGFLVVSATVAGPFTTLAIPAIDGGGLNPILQRPAMLYHPPLLYAGLVAMVVPFAIATASMLRGGADLAWLGLVRRTAGVAWVLLTLGILAGAHWAYGELGWGGFWAWDPIENAALLPWLVATALLHAVLVDEHRAGRAAPRSSTAALATFPFVLVVLGAALTRSGAVSSVHAFAEARAVGWALLALLVLVVAGTAAVVARSRRQEAPPPRWRWSGRRIVLMANGAVLLGAALVVATGTLYPLAAALGGEVLVVGGAFFARFTAPLALATIALLGLGPQLRWSSGPRPGLHRTGPVALAVAGATTLALVALGVRTPFAVIALALAAGSGALLVTDTAHRLRSGAPARSKRRALGAALAHLGALLLLAGVAGSTLVSETTVLLAEGDAATVAGTTFRNDGVVVEEVEDRRRVGVRLSVLRDDRVVARLQPAQTVFPALGQVRSDPDLRSTPIEDAQVVLRRLDADGTALLDIAVRPLVVWVWWGALVLAAGGALVLTGGPALSGPSPPVCGRGGGRRSSEAVRPPAAAAREVAASASGGPAG